MAVTTSLLAITSLARGLSGRIYKCWGVDILEDLFLLNLGILSVATSHNMMTGGNQQLVADLSGGISLVLFPSNCGLSCFETNFKYKLVWCYLYEVQKKVSSRDRSR